MYSYFSEQCRITLTLDSIVDLLDEQLQLHHQSGRVSVRLPRRVRRHHPEGSIHPVLHVKIIVQKLRKIHRSALKRCQELPGACSGPVSVIDWTRSSSSQTVASTRK